MESETARRLIKRIRQLRENSGLTQEKLAEQAGLEYKHYQAVEAGRKLDLRLSTLVKLAKGLGLEPWELLHPIAPEPTVAEPQAKYLRSRKPRKKKKKPRPGDTGS
jgi:transcriptional regulator with XRE-family HTH domain